VLERREKDRREKERREKKIEIDIESDTESSESDESDLD